MRQSDVSKLTKDGLKSEMNGLRLQKKWTIKDQEYMDELKDEYFRRIADEAVNDTTGI
jgi:hypothetical protein